ncbi:hypothetical protein [Roseococcus pinisoli]|uniref:Phage gp6-like head-tail connector protein n=1 Tax=Roseococcus pinisoli TaxID=2835040 RepID=A0ABS5QF81_9PROT|nr:hypothetical protein [Roseococcus pinisoli]MBS7812354.1 hypothetical protein [Roseococcus pinisoli]
MLRLIDEASVRADLGMDAITDYVIATEAAILAATTQLSARLRTPIDRATHEDTFEVATWDDRRQFRLSAGFITEPPVVFWGASADAFEASPLEDRRPWIWDLERGIGMRTTRPSPGVYRFVYDAGFVAADAGTPQTGIPPWLAEAASMLARILMTNNPALKEAGIANNNEVLERALADTLAQKARYAPSSILPFAHRVL